MRTVPRPQPERTAPAAGLADHAARTERARTLHAMIEQAARLEKCDFCRTRAGKPCTRGGGYHLARFQAAERRGMLTRAELAAVVSGLVVIAAGAVVRDPARPIARDISRADLEAALPHVRRRHLDNVEDYLFIGGDALSAGAAARRLGVSERCVTRIRATLRSAGGAA
jgi:hypothetical protein